jgi:hypothetical protein
MWCRTHFAEVLFHRQVRYLPTQGTSPLMVNTAVEAEPEPYSGCSKSKLPPGGPRVMCCP